MNFFLIVTFYFFFFAKIFVAWYLSMYKTSCNHKPSLEDIEKYTKMFEVHVSSKTQICAYELFMHRYICNSVEMRFLKIIIYDLKKNIYNSVHNAQ